MKQLLFFISVFLLSSFSVFSQGPSKINFQAILRNTSGEIVSDKAVSLRMSIIRGTINGNSLYVETHAKTTDVSGLIIYSWVRARLLVGYLEILNGVVDHILFSWRLISMVEAIMW